MRDEKMKVKAILFDLDGTILDKDVLIYLINESYQRSFPKGESEKPK